MKITLSKREKVLIVGSLVAIILFVYVSLVLPGLKEKVQEADNQLANMRSQVTSMEKASTRLAELEEETQALEAYLATHLEDYFGTEMKQEQVLLLIRDLVKEADIDNYELSMDEDASASLKSSLESYYKQKQAETTDQEEAAPESGGASTNPGDLLQEAGTVETPDLVESWTAPEVRVISVTMRFRSDFPALMNFIRLISNYSKQIGIENLSLASTGADSLRPLEGSIRIFLPALEMVEGYYPTPLPDTMEENLEHIHQKADPFEHAGSYREPEVTEPLPEETTEPDEDD